ncbi:MAG TPA: hypothetical protein VKU19_07015 [Bryobacteraceae bacterium]|nr:hypothetical protein [Bryobacteraceae bacterium]
MKPTLLALLLLIVPVASGQQPAATSSDDHQLIQQLLQRVQDLEAEVQRLKGAPTVSAAVPPAAAAQPATPAVQPPTAQTPAPPAPPERRQATSGDMMGMPGMHNVTLPVTEGLQFRGFSDVGFTDSDQKGAHSTFLDGAFNLFITSKVTDKVSVLGELIFEFDPTNTLHTDLERMLITYTPSDYLTLTAGRYHTSIGYYNTAYHHASWLLTTVNRPFLFAFEDQGGILPTHNVGAQATGLIPSGPLGLHWVAEIGNGRTSHSTSGSVAEAVQIQQDENSRKSYNFAAFARPVGVPGFQTGFSVYGDRLYPTVGPRVAETIWDGYLTYHPSGMEFTNEVLVMRHAIEGSSQVYHNTGFYSLLSKNLGKYRPYFSYEYLNIARNEPVWGSIGLRHGPSTGLRYELNESVAFKLEYYRLMRRGIADVNGVRTQIAFTF